MRRNDSRGISIWVAAAEAAAMAAGGCGGKGTGGAAPGGGGGGGGGQLDQAMARWNALATGAGEAMLAAQGCGPRAAAMRDWVTAHGGEAKQAAQALGAFPSKDVEARMDQAEAQHADLEKRMDGARAACSKDEGFQAAWQAVSDSLRPPQAARPEATPPPID